MTSPWIQLSRRQSPLNYAPDADYRNHCNLILDDRVLHDKLQLENQTDTVMDALMNHPLVRSAIRKALGQLKADGKLPIQPGG